MTGTQGGQFGKLTSRQEGRGTHARRKHASRQVGRQSLARADALTWLDAVTGCKTKYCMHFLLAVRSVRADNSSSSATFALSLRGKTKQKKCTVSRGGTGFVLHLNSSRSHWLFYRSLLPPRPPPPRSNHRCHFPRLPRFCVRI